MIDSARDELSQLIRRGLVSLGQSDNQVTLEGYDGEAFPDAEMWQQFGLVSMPPAGAEALFCVIDADGIHPICFATNVRDERPTGLTSGDAMLYAKKSGSDRASVHCKADASVAIGGTKLGTYGATPVAQQSVNTLTDSTTGTPGSTIGPAVGAGNCDATAVNNNFATVNAKLNEIRTVLVNLGLLS
ncbi:MAG: phage baseplate assembly protein [Myxococcales bacterium]|nr:phage baseplate assembly protein [Myxococcales bacterium]